MTRRFPLGVVRVTTINRGDRYTVVDAQGETIAWEGHGEGVAKLFVSAANDLVERMADFANDEYDGPTSMGGSGVPLWYADGMELLGDMLAPTGDARAKSEAANAEISAAIAAWKVAS